jgi:hypothetical protein
MVRNGDVLAAIWMEAVMAFSLGLFWHLPGGSWETMKNPSQDSWCCNQYSNQGPLNTSAVLCHVFLLNSLLFVTQNGSIKVVFLPLQTRN